MKQAFPRYAFAFALLFLLGGHSVHAAKMRVHWTAPTTNTDGSPLMDLAGFRVEWGSCGPNGTFGVFQAGATVGPTVTSAWIYPTNLSPVCARVFAFNSQNAFSASSNVDFGVPPPSLSKPTH